MKISYRNYPALQIYDKQRCKTFINTSDYLDMLPLGVADKSEDTKKVVQSAREYLNQWPHSQTEWNVTPEDWLNS